MQGLHIGKYTLNDIFIERMLGYIRESNFIVHSVFNVIFLTLSSNRCTNLIVTTMKEIS